MGCIESKTIKNNVLDINPEIIPKPVTEPVTEPVAEPVNEPVTEQVSIPELIPELIPKIAPEPIIESEHVIKPDNDYLSDDDFDNITIRDVSNNLENPLCRLTTIINLIEFIFSPSD